MADAAEAELDRVELGRVHVAGNSLGGWIALELARRGRALSAVALGPSGLETPAERDGAMRMNEFAAWPPRRQRRYSPPIPSRAA